MSGWAPVATALLFSSHARKGDPGDAAYVIIRGDAGQTLVTFTARGEQCEYRR